MDSVQYFYNTPVSDKPEGSTATHRAHAFKVFFDNSLSRIVLYPHMILP